MLDRISSVGVCRADATGRFHAVNARRGEMTGLDRNANLDGRAPRIWRIELAAYLAEIGFSPNGSSAVIDAAGV